MAFFGRGKNKHQNPITILDIYNEYVKTVEKDSPYNIPREEYLGICYLFFKTVSKKVIDENQEVKLPSIGEFSVAKRRIKLSNLSYVGTDFKLTNELGVRIKYTNDHSNGFKYFFRWSKLLAKIRNINKYRFTATRRNKRYLAQLIKGRMMDYFEL